MAELEVALVTGANKGIGFAIAEQVAATGRIVVLGTRDLDRGLSACESLLSLGHRTEAVVLDVRDAGSVASAAAWMDARFGHLDILVNNAGTGGPTEAPSDTSAREMRHVFDTNVFGVVSVINAMLPLLVRSGKGRIVNVASHLGSLTLMNDPDSPAAQVNLMAYQASKAALNAITIAYAKQFQGTTLSIHSANPGMVATDLNGHRGKLTPAEGARVVVALATRSLLAPSGSSVEDQGVLVPW